MFGVGSRRWTAGHGKEMARCLLASSLQPTERACRGLMLRGRQGIMHVGAPSFDPSGSGGYNEDDLDPEGIEVEVGVILTSIRSTSAQ